MFDQATNTKSLYPAARTLRWCAHFRAIKWRHYTDLGRSRLSPDGALHTRTNRCCCRDHARKRTRRYRRSCDWFCTSLTAGNLRASILDFKHRFPQVALATVERSRTHLATALRSGVLDILIVAGDLPYTDCKQMTLWSERILVVLPQDHSLAPRDITYWTDLRDETVLLSQYDPGRE